MSQRAPHITVLLAATTKKPDLTRLPLGDGKTTTSGPGCFKGTPAQMQVIPGQAGGPPGAP